MSTVQLPEETANICQAYHAYTGFHFVYAYHKEHLSYEHEQEKPLMAFSLLDQGLDRINNVARMNHGKYGDLRLQKKSTISKASRKN